MALWWASRGTDRPRCQDHAGSDLSPRRRYRRGIISWRALISTAATFAGSVVAGCADIQGSGKRASRRHRQGTIFAASIPLPWKAQGRRMRHGAHAMTTFEYKGYRIEVGHVGQGWRASIYSPGSSTPWRDSPANLEKSRTEDIVAEAKRIIDARLGPRSL